MKFSAILLLPIFLVVLVHQASSQNRFIVAIVERIKSTQNGTRTLCPATIITDRHVLTTADCTQPSNSLYEILVQVQIAEQIGSITSSGTVTVSTDRVFVHPNRTTNNVGVIMIDGRFNVTTLPPRKLEPLIVNATCTLYGWYGAAEFPLTAPVQVLSPSSCNPALPQTYCSVLASSTTFACNGSKGSPIVCSNGYVAGILQSSKCETDQLGRPVIQYHAVSDSKAWIEEVSGAEITKFSVALLVSAVLVTLKNFS